MAKIKQFEAFTNIFVAYKKNWVYILNRGSFLSMGFHGNDGFFFEVEQISTTEFRITFNCSIL